MSNHLPSNKTIAKNTIFLYIRMLVTMLISLYTSRVLLRTLGVEDFGIYGLVGGIVTMFASLKTMFTVATQRFMNIELGHRDGRELNKIFNVSLLVNTVIAIVFIIIVEIGGIWLLENKLNIAPERIGAARWVFQFSVISSVVSIFNIPFDANIIAREKMDVLAAVSIFDAFLKLGIVLLLPFLEGDKLIVYGFLMMLVIVVNLVINVAYCRISFPESKIHKYPFSDIKSIFNEMFAFSVWAFLGNVVFALVNEGVNVLLNIFGSVVANAARSITYQVRGALSTVVSNVYTAVKPQAVQSFARKDMERFYGLMFTGAKVVGYMYILMAIPLLFTLEEVLTLWLGNVPEYAVSFLRASFLYLFVRVLHESVGSFFVTIGRLKEYQIIEFIALGSALPLAYIGLKYFNMPLYGVFLVMTFSEMLNLTAILILANRVGGFDIGRYFNKVLLPYGIMTIVCLVSVYVLNFLLSLIVIGGIWRAIVLIMIALVVQIILMFFLGLSGEERALFMKLINSKK